MFDYSRNPPQTPELTVLARQIHEGEIALPDFQRSFVWRIKDVRDLLVSILKGYFIGVFLMLEIDYENPPLEYRPFEGVERSDIKPKKLVLDGQQRLTSIYYVLYSPNIPLRDTRYPYIFFIDLRKIYEGNIEEAIISIRKEDALGILRDNRIQFEKRLLPFTVLKDINSWGKWHRKAHKYAIICEDNELEKIIGNLAGSEESPIERFLKFQVPVIVISKDVSIDQVVELFERINTTGVRLSVFDLMTARLRRHGIMLRKLWNETLRKHSHINEMKNYPMNIYILQTVALMRGKSPNRAGLLRLEPAGFREDWRKASRYVEKALKRIMNLRIGYGVINSGFMPHITMVPPLAALLAKIDEINGTLRHFEKIDIWYWRSVFTARYAGSPDTTMYVDYRAVSEWLEDDFKRISIELDLSSLDLKGETKRSSAIYKGVMCLIALKGALDFRSGEPPEFNKLNDHHIFPRKFIKKKMPQYKHLMNSVLNRTLLSKETNNWISERPPSEYIRELEKQLGREKLVQILETHFIPLEAYEALKNDDFEDFLHIREKHIKREIENRIKMF